MIAAAAVLLVLPLRAAAGRGSPTAAEPAPPVVRRALPRGHPPSAPTENDLAQYYAGLPGAAGTPLKAWEDSSTWADHASRASDDWQRFFEGRGARMRFWAENRLHPRLGHVRSIIYLFGGPDLVTLQTLFPNTPVFILVGLEPVGATPHPGVLGRDVLGPALAAARRPLYWLLGRGFNETKELREQLAGTPVHGVKPLLYATLARMGQLVIAAEPFTVGNAPALRIEFVTASPGGQIRQLYYICANLSIAGDPAVLEFAARFPPSGGFLKAASYLLFEDGFSRACTFLLDHCAFVLQDDSGIPLRAFDAARWTMAYYGNYRGVMPIFQKYLQPDLLSIYQTTTLAEPILFGVGYRVADADSCLLLAMRGQGAPPPPGPVPAPKPKP